MNNRTFYLLFAILSLFVSEAWGAAYPLASDGSIICLVRYQFQVTNSLLAAVGGFAGLLLVVEGYRSWRRGQFLVSLMLTAYFVYNALDVGLPEKVASRDLIMFVCCLVAGLIMAFFVLWCSPVGIFMLGFGFGSVVGYGIAFILNLFIPNLKSSGVLGPWILVAGCGLVCGVIAMLLPRKLYLIMTSAVFGSFVMANCLDYFLGSQQLERYLTNGLFFGGFHYNKVCGYTWAFWAAGLICAVLGTLLQYLRTCQFHNHTAPWVVYLPWMDQSMVAPEMGGKHVDTISVIAEPQPVVVVVPTEEVVVVHPADNNV